MTFSSAGLLNYGGAQETSAYTSSHLSPHYYQVMMSSAEPRLWFSKVFVPFERVHLRFSSVDSTNTSEIRSDCPQNSKTISKMEMEFFEFIF